MFRVVVYKDIAVYTFLLISSSIISNQYSLIIFQRLYKSSIEDLALAGLVEGS